MIEQSSSKDIESMKQFPEDQETTQMVENKSIACPYRVLTGQWMTLSRPQYKRTCGISSLVSIWNYQFSRLGLGAKEPICVEQAMLKLNLIGNGSIEENFRKKFKKTAELTEKNENENPNKEINENEEEELQEDPQIINNDKSLHEYIDMVDFGCFTGNDTLLKWYRLLCRIYGGSGRSQIFYKTNSDRSRHQDELSAKRGLVEGLNSKGQICFIYHAYDHYFCPVGYEHAPKNEEETDEGDFQSGNITLQDKLCVLVGQSSKMFPCLHSFDWNDIQKDLTTYWPQKFNIRRPKEGVTIGKGKQDAEPKTSTINCIMAFEKLRD